LIVIYKLGHSVHSSPSCHLHAELLLGRQAERGRE
jgi:hypothetical protein